MIDRSSWPCGPLARVPTESGAQVMALRARVGGAKPYGCERNPDTAHADPPPLPPDKEEVPGSNPGSPIAESLVVERDSMYSGLSLHHI